MTWREAIRHRSFRFHVIICLAGLTGLLFFLPYFFHEYLLPKPAIQLQDWVLEQFTPRDCSILIFIFIYGSVLIFIVRHAKRADRIVLGVEAYLLLHVLRSITLSLFTLEAPEGIIPLSDPFVAKVAYGTAVYNKDLFFSGHTATLFLLALLETNTFWKRFLLALTVVVGGMLMLQRVHYTIDVLAAPLAAFLVFWFSRQCQPSSLQINERD